MVVEIVLATDMVRPDKVIRRQASTLISIFQSTHFTQVKTVKNMLTLPEG